MSTCIRDGVRYKRHRWIEDTATKGLICEGCGLFPSTVSLSQVEAVEPGVPEAAMAVEPPLPKLNPFTLDGSSPDGA